MSDLVGNPEDWFSQDVADIDDGSASVPSVSDMIFSGRILNVLPAVADSLKCFQYS